MGSGFVYQLPPQQLNGMLGEFLFPDDFVSNLMVVIEEERRAGEEGLQK